MGNSGIQLRKEREIKGLQGALLFRLQRKPQDVVNGFIFNWTFKSNLFMDISKQVSVSHYALDKSELLYWNWVACKEILTAMSDQ